MSKTNYVTCDLCGKQDYEYTTEDGPNHHTTVYHYNFKPGIDFYLKERQPNASGGEIKVGVDFTWTWANVTEPDFCKECREYLKVGIKAVMLERFKDVRA